LAHIEGCKHSVEITVPVTEVEAEIEQVVNELRKKVRLPGFRPGKVPLDLIRKKFDAEIRQEALDKLLPRHFRAQAEKDNLAVVGSPKVSDVHFHAGEPLRFKVDFEVAPQFDLGEYRGLEVTYREPEVADAEVDSRLEAIRDQKADYINIDPRPIEDGDYAAVSLESIAGLEGKPIQQDETMLHVGAEDSLPEFNEGLRGMSPGDEKEIEVHYPEEYAQERLAAKTVRFRVKVNAVRRKELPELNDEFARDLGDFKDLNELREQVRRSLFAEKEFEAQRAAKEALVDKLVSAHEFPLPEAFIERQIENHVETHLRSLAARGVDPRKVRLDWEKIKESQRDRAMREVKASLLLERIADREAIETTRDEVDREVQRIARQEREPVAAVRMRMEKDGTLGRIANHIRTEKTLNYLFEHARKVADETA
jgi:trigger factor